MRYLSKYDKRQTLYLPSPLLTKEGNRLVFAVLFLPFVSGRISEEGMREG